MAHSITFVYPLVATITVPLVVGAVFLRRFFSKTPVYNFSLTSMLARSGLVRSAYHTKVFWGARLFALTLLALLVAKPQLVDVNSRVQVDGLDIMLVLDASGSMQFPDAADGDVSKFDVAKREAISFIDKRDNDAIGLVLFARDAISRCPLTLDKTLLKKMIGDLHLGIIDPDGTVLATSMITAANRLKESKAKSKVMILLTDGSPSKEDKDLNIALKAVKALGIKVYTIGFGTDKPTLMRHPFFGTMMEVPPQVNVVLLKQIAQQTGGQFFHAQNAHDMKEIYNTIDQLETTKHETAVFSKYYDIFMPFVWFLFIVVLIHIILSSSVWFGL